MLRARLRPAESVRPNQKRAPRQGSDLRQIALDQCARIEAEEGAAAAMVFRIFSRAYLYTRTRDDLVHATSREGDPTDVLARGDGLLEVASRGVYQRWGEVLGQLSHIAKHAGPVPGEHRRIRSGREADGEGFGHTSRGRRRFRAIAAPADSATASAQGLGCSANTAAPEQPRQIRGCRNIIGETELWPPRGHAWIGNDGGMGEIENPMTRKGGDDNPERPLETGCSDRHETGANKRFEEERVSGLTHDGEQHVVRGNHHRDDRIEGSVTIQADAGGKQSHEKCEYRSDESCHRLDPSAVA